MKNNHPNAFHEVSPAELCSVEGGAPLWFEVGKIGIAIGNIFGGERGGAIGWAFGTAIGSVLDTVVGGFRALI